MEEERVGGITNTRDFFFEKVIYISTNVDTS